MPVKQTVTGSGDQKKIGFEFTGNIVLWLSEFERWFKEDTKTKAADIPMNDYFYFLTALYSHNIIVSLQKQGGYESLIEAIVSFYPRETYPLGKRPGDPGFNVKDYPVGTSLLYALDFIAEEFPSEVKTNYEAFTRNFAKSFLWFR